MAAPAYDRATARPRAEVPGRVEPRRPPGARSSGTPFRRTPVAVVSIRSWSPRSPREALAFSVSVAFTLCAGVALGIALLGFSDAALAYVPERFTPSWDRLPAAPGWTDRIRTVEEFRHAGVRSLLSVVWGATALVVASACVIVSAAVLSRGAARRAALAMRVVLGGTAGHVLRFVARDVGWIVLLGGALGWVAGWAIGHALRASWPAAGDRWIDAGVSARALLLAGVLPVAAALLCALAPVATAFRRDLAAGLGTGDRATHGRYEGWVRRVLTVAQFTLSMALMIGSGSLMRATLVPGSSAALGFDPRDTVTMRVELPAAVHSDGARRLAYLRGALERVRAVPGVRAASVVSEEGWFGMGPEDVVTSYCRPACADGAAGSLPILMKSLQQVAASPGYFETLGVRVLGGRAFVPGDAAGAERVAVVTRQAGERLFPGRSPVGQHLLPRREQSILSAAPSVPKYRVVGVVDDVRPVGPGATEMVEPIVYLSAFQHPPRSVGLAVRVGGDPERLRGAILGAVRRGAPGARVRDVMTMEERLDRFAAPVRWTGRVMSGLAAVGVVLVCAGIFATVREGVVRRTQEIGVRMALGARAEQVVWYIVGDALRLARTSLILGTGAAFALTRTLQTTFHGVQAWNAWLYVSVAVLLTGVTALASWLPARRAALVDPMVAIRSR